MEKKIFKEDLDMADIFKNTGNYIGGKIIIREKRPTVDLNFDYHGYDKVELEMIF
jgi:hypothetical protein